LSGGGLHYHRLMRIGLLISELSQRNGWAQYSLKLAEALQKQGASLRIVTARNAPAQPDIPSLPLLPNVNPPDNFALLRMLACFPQAKAFLADCDIIHTAIEAYAPLAVAIASQRPCFITAHGSYVNLPRTRVWPISQLYRQAFRQSRLICVSHYTERVAHEIIPDMRTIVIQNAVDFEQYAALKRVPAEVPTILTAGGVKRRKGTLPLVRAVAKLRETIPSIQCMVIGTMQAEPHYVREVQAEIVALGLEQHVHLLGFVDRETLLGWYAQSHCFVLPSINSAWKFEGFGLTHLEASAAGMPVIGTTDCGAEDAIEHGVTGLLVSQANVEQDLAPAILELLNNPQKAQQMGAAGKEKARQQTWDKVATHVIEAYRLALK
jgi:phosphatidyl-myo-inositol dimannoside synthase